MSSLYVDTEYIHVKGPRVSPPPILHISDSCPGFRTVHSIGEEDIAVDPFTKNVARKIYQGIWMVYLPSDYMGFVVNVYVGYCNLSR